MESNLDLTNGLIMAEAVMMSLGETLGRQEAHDVVYESAQDSALNGQSFASILMGDPRVSNHLARDVIDDILNPVSYVGLSAEMAREAAVRGRKAAELASPARGV